MFQEETFQWSRKSRLLHRCHKMQNYRQIFVNIVTLLTRLAYRFIKYTEDSHLGFSEIVQFSVNRSEAIVAKLVLSLTRLSFPLVRFRPQFRGFHHVTSLSPGPSRCPQLSLPLVPYHRTWKSASASLRSSRHFQSHEWLVKVLENNRVWRHAIDKSSKVMTSQKWFFFSLKLWVLSDSSEQPIWKKFTQNIVSLVH